MDKNWKSKKNSEISRDLYKKLDLNSPNDHKMQSLIENKIELPKFKGSTILVNENSRTELPIKKHDLSVPLWKILRKFVG